jgi:hypothetical protein
MYIFGQCHIENVTSRQKMTDTIVFLGEPAVRSCKKVRSMWSGNWYKITSNFYIYWPMLNVGADVYVAYQAQCTYLLWLM